VKTRKLKHANSILESFEYFCQMSSKLILIILRYTVSKFARFFLRHSVGAHYISWSYNDSTAMLYILLHLTF